VIFDLSSASELDKDTLQYLPSVRLSKKKPCFKDYIVPKPWGKEYLLFENAYVAIWILVILPTQKTSMHCHPNKNTSLLVLQGEAQCLTLTEQFPVSIGQGVFIGKSVFHQTVNNSLEPLILMEIESPVDKFDLVRFSDEYGRQNLGYENQEIYQFKKGLTVLEQQFNSSEYKQVIGHCELTFGFSIDLEGLNLNPLEDQIVLTILNRNVWSDAGEQFIEVGQAFDQRAFEQKLNINKGFQYLLIKRKKS